MHLNRCCWLLLIFAAIGSFFTSWPFAVWLLLVNVLTLVIYGVDKMAARRAWRRVPEIWPVGRLGWRDSGPKAVPPQNAEAAVQDLVRHQYDRQHRRDGGDLWVVCFFRSLSDGNAGGG